MTMVQIQSTEAEGNPAADVVKKIESMGGQAIADYSDVSNFSMVEKMFDLTIKTWENRRGNK